MKLLLDYLPIAIFFIVFKMAASIIDGLAPNLSSEHIDLLRATEPLILATAVLILSLIHI